MFIQQVIFKQFRCFSQYSLSFDAPTVILYGQNGSGKTSILEGLHYLCYVRSFRTAFTRELVAAGTDSFFIKADLAHTRIQAGFADNQRLVKVNDRTVHTYSQLMEHYRVVTTTQDDLLLITGSPEHRRSFIDYALLLNTPDVAPVFKHYRKVLEQRNALLMHASTDFDLYTSWTHSLWECAGLLTQHRIQLLAMIQSTLDHVMALYFPHIAITCTYAPKHSLGASFHDFIQQTSLHHLYQQEKRFKRTLFGTHLDDITIFFNGKDSRTFISRGQQRLLALLLRISLITLLEQRYGPVILLLDDIMADFDTDHLDRLLQLIHRCQGQRIFTVPRPEGSFEHLIGTYKPQRTTISI